MDADLDKRLKCLERLSLLAAKNVLSVKDAALLMGRSEKTVRNRLDEIPHYYGPMGVTFKREELETWMCKVKCDPVQVIEEQPISNSIW